jgi:hypothetical protein
MPDPTPEPVKSTRPPIVYDDAARRLLNLLMATANFRGYRATERVLQRLYDLGPE